MPPVARPLRDVLAAGVKGARLRLGLRQDDAAARLRAYGLTTWLRGTVAQAETGSRRFSLEEVVLLALAYETIPAELVAGKDNELVELAPEARVSVAALRALLSGDAQALLNLGPQVMDTPATRGGSTKSARSSRFPDVLADARRFGIRRHGDVDRALERIGDPERYAARKLGTTPERINLAALALWGRTLAEERDHRVKQQEGGDTSARGLQALRGHVTRDLMTELDTELRRKGLV
jgi:hypothetical protein